MSNKNHSLYNYQTDKIFTIHQTESKIIYQSGKKEKLRTTEKEFSTIEEATKFFIKKEWEMLKKGFVLNCEKPNNGNAKLHYFVGGGYTGCLSFENTPKGIYIYKSDKDAEGFKDFLVLIDDKGKAEETIELPKVLAWSMYYNTITNSLLLDLDHAVYEYSLKTKMFTHITETVKEPYNFVAFSNTKIAYGIKDRTTIITKDKEVKHQGAFVKGTFSTNENQLALYNTKQQIKFLDSISGNFSKKIDTIPILDDMKFAMNDKLLIILEKYGTLRYFNTESATEMDYPDLEIPNFTKEVNVFCLNKDNSKMVLVQRTKAYVFDFKAKKFLYKFDIKHAVKTVKINFIGDLLAVRTDYGCFSLYKI